MNGNAFKLKKGTLVGLLFPGTLVYAFFVLVPLLVALRYSLYNWSGGPRMTFIGLANYLTLMRDADFWNAFKNNVVLIVMCVVFQLGISFILALVLSSNLVRFANAFRMAIFLPVVVSPVVVGILWQLIYSNDHGILNWALRALGMGALVRPWLDDPSIVMYSVSVAIVWQYLGIYLMIFMAGMQGIPADVYESALMDGASGVRKTFSITIPLMSDTFKVAVMLSIAGNMKIFDHIYVMTGGGPGKSSMVMAMYAYNSSFRMFRFGYANAMSIGMLILSLAIILLSRRLMASDSR